MSLFLLFKLLVIIISSNNDIYGNTVTVVLARIKIITFLTVSVALQNNKPYSTCFCLLWYLLLYWSAGTNHPNWPMKPYFKYNIIFTFVSSSIVWIIICVNISQLYLLMCSTIARKMYFNWHSFSIQYGCKTTWIKI